MWVLVLRIIWFSWLLKKDLDMWLDVPQILCNACGLNRKHRLRSLNTLSSWLLASTWHAALALFLAWAINSNCGCCGERSELGTFTQAICNCQYTFMLTQTCTAHKITSPLNLCHNSQQLYGCACYRWKQLFAVLGVLPQRLNIAAQNFSLRCCNRMPNPCTMHPYTWNGVNLSACAAVE